MLKVSKLLSLGLALAVLPIGAGVGNASQKPPSSAKALTKVVAALEKDGYQIVEASFDDGRWELEGYREENSYEIWVDPDTGKVLSTHRDDADPLPPAGVQTLSKILEAVEQAGYAPITSAEFERGRWEIEAYHDLAKRELQVDAKNGKVLSDRAD